MSGPINNNLTLSKAINNTEILYNKLLRSTVANTSRTKQDFKVHHPSTLLRAELIHLGNVRTRALLTSRNIKTQEELTQGPRNVMEEKHQKNQSVENQNVAHQTLSQITSKLTSLFSKKNLLNQGTNDVQNSTTVSKPTLDNQDVYPLAGNIAASTDTNTELSLQAGETPSQAAINIINISAPELAEQLPVALNQSINTLSKMGEKFAQRPINASLL